VGSGGAEPDQARGDAEVAALEARIGDAGARREAARKQYNRLLMICITAKQARPLLSSSCRTSLRRACAWGGLCH
jgi:hypothetical protein